MGNPSTRKRWADRFLLQPIQIFAEHFGIPADQMCPLNKPHLPAQGEVVRQCDSVTERAWPWIRQRQAT